MKVFRKMKQVKALLAWSSPTPKDVQLDMQHKRKDQVIKTLAVSEQKIFDNDKRGLIYCWVESLPIMQNNYIFGFTLFAHYSGKTYQHQFTSNISQIQKLLNLAQNHQEYFAAKAFPLCM